MIRPLTIATLALALMAPAWATETDSVQVQAARDKWVKAKRHRVYYTKQYARFRD